MPREQQVYCFLTPQAHLSRLTDAYLNEALELGEYLERKNALTAEKRTLEEKLSDFERKGNHWLELMRNWIIEANQAGNLSKQENLSGMKDFLVDIGSNRRLAAGMLLAEFKTPWNFLAEMPAQARAFGAGAVNLSSNSELWTRQGSNLWPSRCERDALPLSYESRDLRG